MARWLLDCEPLCGHSWRLGVATTSDEREKAYRLRYEVFVRECGYLPNHVGDELDTDTFDSWCDHLILWDDAVGRVIGTYRAIFGGEALKRGGLYGSDQFDYTPLSPILNKILQGGRTCVDSAYRNGPAFLYLSYGMELLLREYKCDYFLGAESFKTDDPQELNRIDSYIRKYAADPDWFVQPQPACIIPNLREIPVTEADEKLMPSLIRADLRMGFRACSPPAWDPHFGSYDVLMMGRRDSLSRAYNRFIERIENALPR